MVTGYKHEMIEEKLKSQRLAVTIYNPFYSFTNVLASFWLGMQFISDDFLYLHGDTIFDIPILTKLLNSAGDIVLPVDIGKCDGESMKVQVDSTGHLIRINKTMDVSKALGEFIGIAKVKKSVLPDLRKSVESHLGNCDFGAFFEEALQDLLDQQSIAPINVEFCPLDVSGHYWAEIDYLKDYHAALKNFPQSQLSMLFP